MAKAYMYDLHVDALGGQPISWKVNILITRQAVADPGGANSAMAPPSKLAMEFGPLGGRKSNDSTVNMLNSKDFAPPYRCRLRICSPYGKYHIKT